MHGNAQRPIDKTTIRNQSHANKAFDRELHKLLLPRMAAMQDHPPPADAPVPAAEAYIHRLTAELSTPSSGSNSELVLLLRQRPHAACFPAAVSSALDDLEELYSEGSAPMAALERDAARARRAEQEEMLRDAWDTLLSVSRDIVDLAADLATTNDRLQATRASIRRTLERLPVAMSKEDGGADENSAIVVSLVERLSHEQAEEAPLMVAMEEMKAAFEQMRLQRDAAEAWVLAENTALEAHPELPPSSKEEDELIYEATDRYNENFFILLDFRGEPQK
ncbi:hypothetical protein E2562_032866 [Oryza meyeriana var. granulata]|uniref:Uncharacterized protein n=1 Tax=Oryza meyeriana var. granulata TaxID=110450 RepID=A0A6G1BPP8_9ORYZ|nr:hypothetical protein E2562_032866 [Oryza meyeriana var. granulata]